MKRNRDYFGEKNPSYRHGLSRTTEHTTYFNARRRCENKDDVSFKYYGARGIKFLYKTFDDFISDVGLKPSKEYCLDRIDTDGNYEKGNCRWVTQSKNSLNRRKYISNPNRDELGRYA